MTLSSPVSAQDFAKGLDAYKMADYAAALKEWRPLAENGHARASLYLGWFYENGKGVGLDINEAEKWYTIAADAGLAEGQFRLAQILEMPSLDPLRTGDLFYPTAKKILKLYRQSADQGHKGALFWLGTKYYFGYERESIIASEHKIEILENKAKASEFFTKAALKGHRSAQNYLSLMYANGDGVLQNYEKSFEWMKLAAEQGHPDAVHNLALSYETGRGVTKNHKKAAKWYFESAKNNAARSQLNLGLLYLYGRGVLQSNVKAHMWGNLASYNGDPKGKELMAKAAKDLSSDNLNKAQKLAETCLQSSYANCD